MPPRQSDVVVAQTRMLLDSDVPPTSIALQLGISRRTVERWRLSIELFGASYPPAFSKQGRPRALTNAQLDWMLAYLNDRPSTYLDELALVMFDDLGVELTDSVEVPAAKAVVSQDRVAEGIVPIQREGPKVGAGWYRNRHRTNDSKFPWACIFLYSLDAQRPATLCT